MLNMGLTSVTFRKLSPSEIITLVKESGIHGIEWGGDVHVPPGDLERARDVREKTEAAGLSVCSYGSYYRCDEEAGDFSDILATAQELHAPVVRVWAGGKGSDAAEGAYREEVIESLDKAVSAANEMGITVALEYHRNTLTDTQASAHQLLEEVGLPELKLYWQPRTGGIFQENIAELEAALPKLAYVHLFHWGTGEDGSIDRRPLAEGVEIWEEYLQLIRQADGDRFILFEFVLGDRPEQLREDAKVLNNLLNK
jgi:3-dehydroshikimate dehydratase